MEPLSQTLQKMNFEDSQNHSLTISDSNEVSLYNDDLTKVGLANQAKRILNIFPKFPLLMLGELKNAFAENNFTDKRIEDAVNYVRDSYTGWDKLPNIANFISFDKKVKIYTHNQVTENNLWNDVEIIRIKDLDKPRWILKEDFLKGNFEKWEKK